MSSDKRHIDSRLPSVCFNLVLRGVFPGTGMLARSWGPWSIKGDSCEESRREKYRLGFPVDAARAELSSLCNYISY